MVAAEEPFLDVTFFERHVGIYVVLDRMPTGTSLPSINDVFGETTNTMSSMLDQHVRLDQLGRFKVLAKEKRYVNSNLHGSMVTINRYMKFGGRNKIVTVFKDMGTSTGGTYRNIRDNALLLFVMWESAIPSYATCSTNNGLTYFH